MIVLGVICVLAGAVVAGRQPSESANVAGVNAQADEYTSRSSAPVKAATVKAPALDSSTTTVGWVKDSSMDVRAAAEAAPVRNPTSVTITGCLERDDQTFWLNDTSGTDAPKSRSWRSGFLKKRPSRIELVDQTHTLRLPNHLGQRVKATGTLTKEELQARSLERVATSCD